jgi:branched-chain amino acid transport system substrate-binding protein
VGLLLPYTGVFALQAKGATQGIELLFDEIGKKAGGREIQVIKEDSEMNPTVGLTKVRRLVEEHKVNFVVGPVSSAVALAIHPYISEQKVILIVPVAFTRALTSPKKAKYNIFRTIETTDQGCYPLGKWMYDKTPHRKVVIAGSDFAAGRHSVEAFKAGFEDAGGKVIKEVYPKLRTMDFAPFLAAMDAPGADAVYAWFAGTDAIRFVQQYKEFGLKKKLPLFGYSTLTDDPLLPSLGDASLGVITNTHYASSLDIPRNRAFVKSFKDKYGEAPNRYAEPAYVAGQMIGAVADALKGDIEDIPRTAKTIRKVAGGIDSPSGPVDFDQYNQRIINIYIQKVEKRDGKLVNVVIDTPGKVSQEDVWKWRQK